MTRRRDLERAVIEAARNLDFVYGEGPYVPIVPECIDTLVAAIQELDKLREAEKPRANRVAPITSHQAAEWAFTRQATWHARIFCKLFHSGGNTVDEMIRDMFGATHQTVSARVNELSNAGWIVDSGRTRTTRTGANAIVWAPSPAARQAVEDGRQSI